MKTRKAARSGVFTSAFRFEFPDAIVLALYATVLTWGIDHHRPWLDEAQAWLIARDDSTRDMLLRRLHYEGAPALWHLLLKLVIHLHLPYAGLNWLGGVIAFMGVFVFIRFSPFPRVFRWLIPFTFYLQYQYAVIARPYVLYPLLLFALCVVYSQRTPRPIQFALLAGLLANLNFHAAVLSCSFAVVYFGELHRESGHTSPRNIRYLAFPICLFLSLCASSVATAFPAPDAMVKPVATGRVKTPNHLLGRLIPPERAPASAIPLDPPLNEVPPSTPAQSAPHGVSAVPAPTFAHRAVHKLLETMLVAGDVATFPISESNALSIACLLTIAVWLWSRASLRFALPWLIAVPLAAFVWIYDHHTGMFVLALVAAVWISLSRQVPVRGSRVIAAFMSAVALLVVVLQITWTAHAMRAETYHPYDPGREAEAFLVKNYAGRRIAGFGFETVSLQPYATRNLFDNWDQSYLLWSNMNPVDLRRTEALRQHPDVVVIADLIQQQDSLYNQWTETSSAGSRPSTAMIDFWQGHGYRETHRFCGTRYMRAGSNNAVCELLFEPEQTSKSNAKF